MIPPYLTLSNIRYVSRVKWSNPGKGVAPSSTPQCSSYWKGSLLVALNYSRQFYFFYLLLDKYNYKNPFYYHYYSELKVLQYLVKVRHNLTASDTFAETVKVTQHTRLCDAKLIWYFPSTTHQICLYGWEHGLGIYWDQLYNYLSHNKCFWLFLHCYGPVQTYKADFPVSWDRRIHRLYLCRGVRPLPHYDTKQSNGEAPVMLEFWGMQSTPSLPLLPCPLWPRVVAPDRALSMG